MFDEIISTLEGAKNECTDAPYWLIIDPGGRNIKTKGEEIAHCITGPYFSREDAEEHLKNRRYHFGPRTIVWCASGCWSRKYKAAYKQLTTVNDAGS